MSSVSQAGVTYAGVGVGCRILSIPRRGVDWGGAVVPVT